jgi:hypothetical protein
MNKKKIIKTALILLISGVAIAGSVSAYMFFMPHRDVQSAATDYSLNASDIVNEYLTDAIKADEKYLDEEGESKILEVKGIVSEISEDFNGNKVVLLKAENDKAGVECTFMPETNVNISNVFVGENIKVKGVIRAGASFDEDLGMYENVIMEKCDIVK